jgi:hypothetical protein
VIKFDSEFVTDHWFSPDIPVPSTNKTDCHNIAEVLLEVVLNTIALTSNSTIYSSQLEVAAR